MVPNLDLYFQAHQLIYFSLLPGLGGHDEDNDSGSLGGRGGFLRGRTMKRLNRRMMRNGRESSNEETDPAAAAARKGARWTPDREGGGGGGGQGREGAGSQQRRR